MLTADGRERSPSSACIARARSAARGHPRRSCARSPTRSSSPWTRAWTSRTWARSRRSRTGSCATSSTSRRRAIAWLHGLASGDWVAAASTATRCRAAALLDDLPRLVRGDRRPAVLAPDGAGTFPDPQHWLDERPWYPDFHNRLVRNDATLDVPRGAARHRRPRAARRGTSRRRCTTWTARSPTWRGGNARSRSYEASRPGLQAPGGGAAERALLPARALRAAPAPAGARGGPRAHRPRARRARGRPAARGDRVRRPRRGRAPVARQGLRARRLPGDARRPRARPVGAARGDAPVRGARREPR